MLRPTAVEEIDELHEDLDLDIRHAARADMSTIADFIRSSADWYREFVEEEDMSEHDVDASWEEENFLRRHFFVGRTDEGEDVGTISMQFFGDVAYLGYIYLDVGHVGKGYGHELMTFAERVAREAGIRTMILIAHPEAEWAKKAYLKYGFEIIETEPERILAWRDGLLGPYYEQGFELYGYDLTREGRPSTTVG